MSNVISLPINDRWLFSVDVVRTPGGGLAARLTDIRTDEIWRSEEPANALKRLANALTQAAEGMKREAEMIGPSNSEPD